MTLLTKRNQVVAIQTCLMNLLSVNALELTFRDFKPLV